MDYYLEEDYTERLERAEDIAEHRAEERFQRYRDAEEHIEEEQAPVVPQIDPLQLSLDFTCQKQESGFDRCKSPCEDCKKKSFKSI